MERKEAESVRVKDIWNFVETPLGQRMKAASEKRLLFREQPFVIARKASELDPQWQCEENVLVQGIIDAYFICLLYTSQEMIEDSGDRALLQMKLKDVAVLYQAFTGYLKDHYMTGEEVMDALEKALPFSKKMKNSVLLLDGYTGFTPIQMRVVGELLAAVSYTHLQDTVRRERLGSTDNI